MTCNLKTLTQKQKIILCASFAVAAIAVAIGATFLVRIPTEESPTVVLNTTQSTPLPDMSAITTPDYVYRPEATVVVTSDGAKEKLDAIINAANRIKPSENNKIIVLNHAIDDSKLIKRKSLIPVEFLSQELPSGSEITALTTLLNFYGYDVSQAEIADDFLDKTTDKLGDFRETFVGNPSYSGFGCYAKPIVNAANRYIKSENDAYVAVDYSGAKFEDLLKLVESDVPVIIWSTTYSESAKTLQEPYSLVKWSSGDEYLTWIAPEHCLVLVGYDLETNVGIVSDPKRGIVEYDLETLKARYLALDSQCIVLEKKPVITGVENNTTYYTTQCVSVSEHNVDSITVNGNVADYTFLINGNIEDTYQIEVTEKNGNVIKYVVFTKPISSMYDIIGDINEFTATEKDRENITALKELASSAVIEYSSYNEIQQIETIINACDSMLNNIDAVAEKLEIIKQTAESYENIEVNFSHYDELIKFSEDIKSLSSSSNLSNEQKIELNDISTKCDQWLETILSAE